MGLLKGAFSFFKKLYHRIFKKAQHDSNDTIFKTTDIRKNVNNHTPQVDTNSTTHNNSYTHTNSTTHDNSYTHTKNVSGLNIESDLFSSEESSTDVMQTYRRKIYQNHKKPIDDIINKNKKQINKYQIQCMKDFNRMLVNQNINVTNSKGETNTLEFTEEQKKQSLKVLHPPNEISNNREKCYNFYQKNYNEFFVTPLEEAFNKVGVTFESEEQKQLFFLTYNQIGPVVITEDILITASSYQSIEIDKKMNPDPPFLHCIRNIEQDEHGNIILVDKIYQFMGSQFNAKIKEKFENINSKKISPQAKLEDFKKDLELEKVYTSRYIYCTDGKRINGTQKIQIINNPKPKEKKKKLRRFFSFLFSTPNKSSRNKKTRKKIIPKRDRNHHDHRDHHDHH